MACAGATDSKHRHVSDEFFDAWDFLEWAADADEFSGAVRSRFDLDVYCVFICGDTAAVFDQAAGCISFVSHGFAVYWLNILLLGSVLYLCWRYANRAGLIKEDTPREIRRAIRRRVVIAQLMYAAGAVLCVINTRWSIACIFVVQLYYAVAPRRLQVGRV